MHITQIRNATLIIEYASTRFLIDPMLAEKHAFPPFAGTPNDTTRNPTVDLPFDLTRITDVDAVIVTHTHLDHWDAAASAAIPKSLPMFAQHQTDADMLRGEGFTDVRLLSEQSWFRDVRLTKTPGQHGSDEAIRQIGHRLRQVCGVVFQHSEEPKLYLAGDTVWNAFVVQSLAAHAPDVILLNCGDAQINGLGSIIMGTQDVLEVARAAPKAMLVATHMEAVNHATLSRAELRKFAEVNGFSQNLIVPEDGEQVCLPL